MPATVKPKDSLFAAMVKKESGFFSFGKRGRRQKKKKEEERKKDVNLVLAYPKISSYFSQIVRSTSLLSSIQVFNLKSARWNRVAPSLSLHKMPALFRIVAYPFSFLSRIPLHQCTHHQVGWCSRVHKFPHLDPKIIFFGVRLSCFPIGNSILPDNACNPLSFWYPRVSHETHTPVNRVNKWDF